MSDFREKQKRAHRVKYEALARRIGVDALLAILPRPIEQIHRALDEGDEHLNTWGNGPWDRATGYSSGATEIPKCGCCGQVIRQGGREWYKRRAAWAPPWDKTKELHLSNAERCCILKHVAIYHTNYEPKKETTIG